MMECRVCKIVPQLLGKRFFMPALGHRYEKLLIGQVMPHLAHLSLVLVGGLPQRGWTMNDIDVIGKRSDAAELHRRLQQSGIANPVHWCGTASRHSHIQCAYFGIKLAVTGRGY